MFHKIDQWLEDITEKMVLWISDESSVTEEQLIIRKFALQSIVNEVLKLIILAIFFGMLGELTLYVCCVVTLTSTRCFMHYWGINSNSICSNSFLYCNL